MKNKKVNYLIIGTVILVCFIVFGLGGYYLRKQNQPSPSPITAAVDRMDNWKIYTDTKSGFSLKYPSDYFIFQGDPTLGFFLATSAPKGGNGPKFLGEDDIWFGASSAESTLTLVVYNIFCKL